MNDDKLIEKVARAMAIHEGWDNWDTAKTFNDTPSGNDPEDEREYWLELARVAVGVIKGKL